MHRGINLSTNEFAAELHTALRARKPVAPLTVRAGDLTIDAAYAISLEFLALRVQEGERIVGKKIGVTSKPVQDMLQVDQPDFGFLTDAMQVREGDEIEIRRRLIQPRTEAEMAFILRKDITGPGVTAQQVLEATEAVAPCIEVVDSRIIDWKIRIQDTIADNASCGAFVLGDARFDPREFNLPAMQVRFFKNGRLVSEGHGAAVQGSPLNAVAWLANTLGRYGVSLEAGDIVLSGSMVPLEPAAPGDVFQMQLSAAGRDVCGTSVRFV